jgi:YHS domain-containing protein
MIRIPDSLDLELIEFTEQKEVTTMAKDPVCGMEVDEKKAAATSSYDAKTYYFCGKGCKAAFDKEPAKYLSGEKSHA